MSQEQELLASLDASLHEQDAYEDAVIREATHQLAPTLTGVGLPPLHSLAPSYNALRPGSFNPADLSHFYTILSQTRRKIHQAEQQEHRLDNDQTTLLDKLLLKEQLLLSFLSHTAKIPLDELPVRVPEERAREAKRSSLLHRQNRLLGSTAVANKNLTNRNQQRSLNIPTSDTENQQYQKTLTRRVPMMKRKLEELESSKRNQVDEDDIAAATEERKEQLKQLRLERKRRKLERQKALQEINLDASDDGENELISDQSETVGKKVEPFEVELKNKDDTTHDTVSESNEKSSFATCPLCCEEIVVKDELSADAVLSQHMDACQRQKQVRRVTRQSTKNSHTVNGLRNGANGGKTESIIDTLSSRPKSSRNKPVPNKATAVRITPKSIDDLDEYSYEDRVDDWIENGLSRMKHMTERDDQDVMPGEEEYPGRLRVPAWINDRLFEYQRTALKWMWDLHQQEAGGLIGDEMGLGKTVQVSSFLGVLTANRKVRAVLVISPATMLQHWLNELAIWAPGLRRILVHQSGETDGESRVITPRLLQLLSEWLKKARSDRLNEAIDDEERATSDPHSFPGTGYVVITTYESLRRNSELYITHPWTYIVLDEAQKIRNPDADVTIACKRIRTPHRIAMSGTPIQNDLRELWSLFDFVFPGRLGTLPAFEQEFAEPIRRGGYSNASPVQVQLAYRCSIMLKDLIDPYLLRRRKKEVKEVSRMPGKTEHVLFCRLSHRQREMYEAFLQSDEVKRVLRGTNHLFAAVTMLRKICNHPDLVCDPDKASFESFLQNGSAPQNQLIDDDSVETDDDDVLDDEESLVERAGKLEVLSKILPLWHKQGHRVLIFCQWRKMLNIIQKFTMANGWKFGRLDGNTNVAARQRLVDTFNSDDSYYGMLCTTRTGGVGLNLTGANRIILYDPDWNPQTDAQARERAWRFGQQREVTVYRLITAGTVEEKIYQRQIFKTALSNRVLQDPRQRRLFSQRDLRDLFTLKADNGSIRTGSDGVTETVVVTKGVGQVDLTEEASEDTSADNEATLRSVMKSKGLAGIFDHNFIEQDPLRKSVTTRELEEQAKRVAREAANALRQSVKSHNRFAPTWTGSRETAVSRFGSSSAENNISLTQKSSNLLQELRQRNSINESQGQVDIPSEEAKQYATLMVRISNYVRCHRPTTDDLLQEFTDVPASEIAIFRRLLKSVASVDNGRWRLKAY